MVATEYESGLDVFSLSDVEEGHLLQLNCILPRHGVASHSPAR
jgi:hypothetical protein